MDNRFEEALRCALVEAQSGELEDHICGAIRREASRRRRVRLAFRCVRNAAAALLLAAVMAELYGIGSGSGGQAAGMEFDEGDLALDIIGFSTPCAFYSGLDE